ncbi:MAG: VWA domain-containing protein [Chloroflexaceae bacterium]|nr:VWA domain-containing protein [Chloroflexaceae bacterium]
MQRDQHIVHRLRLAVLLALVFVQLMSLLAITPTYSQTIEVICDSEDENCLTNPEDLEGVPFLAGAVDGMHGERVYLSENNSGISARLVPNIPQDGYYAIDEIHPAIDGVLPRTSSATYRIQDRNSTRIVKVDQMRNPGQWNEIAREVWCEAGRGCAVEMSDQTDEPDGTRRVYIDAVRFRFVRPADDPPPPPPGPGYCGPIDLVLAIDTTNTTLAALNNIAEGAEGFIGELQAAAGVEAQLGLVVFESGVRVIHDLAPNNTDEVLADLQRLPDFQRQGGNSYPEPSDEALNTIINGLDEADREPGQQTGDFNGVWREDARKVIVLLTDALPAGLDDTYTPGVDDVQANAMAEAAAAQGIEIVPILVPTYDDPNNPGAQQDPDRELLEQIMQNYADVTGGTFRKTAPDGSNTLLSIQDFLSECPITGQPDIWMRDNLDDDSIEPSTGVFYASPDITVCHGPNQCAQDETLVRGAGIVNSIYVTLRNHGYKEEDGPQAARGKLALCYSPLGGHSSWDPEADGNCTGDWIEVGVVEDIFISANTDSVTVRVEWPGERVPAAAHYCMIARWISDEDPMNGAEGTYTAENVRNNNNIVWQNFNVVNAAPGRIVAHDFAVRPLGPGIPTDLVIEPDNTFPGTITVDASAITTTDVIEGQGIVAREGNRITLSSRGGRLSNLIIPGNAATVRISYRIAPGAPAGMQTIDVYQQVLNLNGLNEMLLPDLPDLPEDGNIGGARLVINILPEGAPPVRTQPVIRLVEAGTQLVWVHEPENQAYEVWAGDTADFTPGVISSTLLMTITPALDNNGTEALSYTHALTDTGVNAPFYRIRSVNSTGDTVDSLARSLRPQSQDVAFTMAPAPAEVWGLVDIRGRAITETIPIRAVSNGRTYAEGVITHVDGVWRYALSMPGDILATDNREGGRTGDIVNLVIGDQFLVAEEKVRWVAGSTQYVNLTLAQSLDATSVKHYIPLIMR